MASMFLNLSLVQKGCQVAPIFCEYSSIHFNSRASTNLWSADYMAIILLKSATSNCDRVRKLFCNALPEVMDGNKGDDETNECNRTERECGGGIGHCLLKSATIVLLASSTARVT